MSRLDELLSGLKATAIKIARRVPRPQDIGQTRLLTKAILATVSELEAELSRQSTLLNGLRTQAIKDRLVLASDIVRELRSDAGDVLNEPQYATAAAKPIDDAFTDLEALNPRLYPVWRKLFDNAIKPYRDDPTASCSHRENEYARLFGAYIALHGRGRLLDIGCGPQGRPSYLGDWPSIRLAGLDPLPSWKPVEFERVQGFNEFLPWPDNAFDTVVSGAALDHVLSIDRSLEEITRTLTPEGRYLVWLASVPGSAAFDSDAENFKPIDDFHLFHFDRTWIEPIFEKYFVLKDITVVPQVGFDHVFYCLTQQRS